MKEQEIRPLDIFDKYLELCNADIEIFFKQKDMKKMNCPACQVFNEMFFIKNTFSYCKCKNCNTLYVSPRPKERQLLEYYTSSKSVQYWSTTFYKKTEKARREKLWKPKAREIKKFMISNNLLDYSVVDIGGGYGIFGEEIRKLIKKEPIIVEPSPSLAKVCKFKNLETIEKFIEHLNKSDLPEGPKLFTSFELFEHVYSPLKYLQSIKDLMEPNDYFIFTTLSGSGLDIQLLGKESKSVSPPHHLNFFNPYSIKILVEKCKLEIIKIKTPGHLDMSILQNNKEYINDTFWSGIINESSDKELAQWQKFIAKMGKSSHMMVVIKKS